MKILFICTHNRCRSILAEAITNHVGGSNIQAVSAGSSPQGQVHPLSLHYLSEHSISIDGLKSQSWDDFDGFNPDAIITLCDSAAQETCPVWFGDSVQAHWGLADPSKLLSESEQGIAFNNTIDILERRGHRLLETINASTSVLVRQDLQLALNQIAAEIN